MKELRFRSFDRLEKLVPIKRFHFKNLNLEIIMFLDILIF